MEEPMDRQDPNLLTARPDDLFAIGNVWLRAVGADCPGDTWVVAAEYVADLDRIPAGEDPRVAAVLELVADYAGIDGAHHKQWVLDQVVRILTGPGYDAWIAQWADGEDGPATYSWDEGIAP
jgi:hypothetical protein